MYGLLRDIFEVVVDICGVHLADMYKERSQLNNLDHSFWPCDFFCTELQVHSETDKMFYFILKFYR